MGSSFTFSILMVGTLRLSEPSMPAKKKQITEEERRKRIRETAREIGTSDDPKNFERAFKRVTAPSKKPSL